MNPDQDFAVFPNLPASGRFREAMTMTIRARRFLKLPTILCFLLATGSTAVGCSGKTDSPAKAPQAVAAAATEAAKPVEPPKPAPKPEPVWPDPLPSGWKIFNDYETTFSPRKTIWGGYWDSWGFRGGKCVLTTVDDSGSRRLNVQFALPMDNSQCGTFEYLAGDKGKPKPVDISGYDGIAFLLKSGDADDHKVRFEITELDQYDAALQGYTGETAPLTAGKEWVRHEVRFDKVLHPMFDRRKGKQVGIRIDRKDQGSGGSGVVLMDNVTFLTKGAGTR